MNLNDASVENNVIRKSEDSLPIQGTGAVCRNAPGKSCISLSAYAQIPPVRFVVNLLYSDKSEAHNKSATQTERMQFDH